MFAIPVWGSWKQVVLGAYWPVSQPHWQAPGQWGLRLKEQGGQLLRMTPEIVLCIQVLTCTRTSIHTHAPAHTHECRLHPPPPDTEAGGIWSKYMIHIFENAIMKAAILGNQGALIYFSDMVWFWHCGPTSANCCNRCQEVSCWKTTKRKVYVLHGFSIASNC